MTKKGFTLIELLVVIAIIGILSSIAIVYLGDARQKANNAKVQSNVTTASTQLELDRANGTEFSATTGAALVAAVKAKLGTAPCTAASWLSTNDTAYTNIAIYSTLCTTGNIGGDIFCADSYGFRGNVTAMPGTPNGKCQ